ncbi:MAG: helix-turn-helix transcriptional regulator, partial [Bacilli bacterium]|nr:helix-turn-helix transcriptional regulator [Bacilli bacterium]
MNQKKIGKFIQERRKLKELTQVELAEKLGVSNRTISSWENGNSLPDYSMFQGLCNELDISIVELLNGEIIETEDFKIKTDDAIKNTIEYSNITIKKSRIKNIISTLLIVIILSIGFFFG